MARIIEADCFGRYNAIFTLRYGLLLLKTRIIVDKKPIIFRKLQITFRNCRILLKKQNTFKKAHIILKTLDGFKKPHIIIDNAYCMTTHIGNDAQWLRERAAQKRALAVFSIHWPCLMRRGA